MTYVTIWTNRISKEHRSLVSWVPDIAFGSSIQSKGVMDGYREGVSSQEAVREPCYADLLAT